MPSSPAGGDQEVLPAHLEGPRAGVVAAGQLGQIGVPGGHALGVVGDAAVRGDGGPVAAFEVVAELLRAAEPIDDDRLAAQVELADPLAEQPADVLLVPPEGR